MGRNNRLKAYVQYNKLTRKIVPGSLIFREHQPKDGGIWREVPTVKCCTGSKICSSEPWINDLFPSNSSVVAAALDSNCNAYLYVDYDGPSFYKFNSAGEIIWKRFYAMTIDGSSVFLDGTNVNIGPDDVPYFTNDSGVLKVDPQNGDIIWHKLFGADGTYIYPSGIVFDNDGNFFISAETDDLQFKYAIGKFNSDTGDLIDQVGFEPYPATLGATYLAYGSSTDASGNIYFPTAISESINGYCGPVFKFDSNLNFVSVNVINPTIFTSDTDIIGFGTDLEGNSYVSGYGQVLYRINVDGSLGWAYTMLTANSTFDIYVSQFACDKSTGDVFWIIGDSQVTWDPDGSFFDMIAIAKFDKDGNYIWGTEISRSNGNISIDWYSTNTATQISNGMLQIGCYTSNPTSYFTSYIKMPAGDQLIGTFGEYTFRDITSLLIPTPFVADCITPPHSTGAFSGFSQPNVYTNVTFTNVTDNITVTNIPLS